MLHEPALDSASERASFYRPAPPLDRFVDGYWVADDYVARAPRERVLPNGTQVLIVHLGADPLHMYPDAHATQTLAATSTSILCGARQTPIVIGTAFGPTVGVHFKPAGARAFFDVPADAIAGGIIALEQLWDRAASSLREQLQAATAPLQRVRIIEAFLLAHLRRSFELTPALRLSLEAFEDPELASVAEINRRTGLSPRRLSELFRSEVGLSPKAYWRVRRFRAVLRDLECGRLHGAALATEHGYCDQPHFLREFRTFAGGSPREFLAARVVGTDHVSVFE